MKQFEDIELTLVQSEALKELRQRLRSHFKIEALILFGSIVRGEADNESDIDLLVVTSEHLSRLQRHQITDTVFEINLQYGTNFSTLVVDRESWETGPISVLPIHSEIISQGVTV